MNLFFLNAIKYLQKDNYNSIIFWHEVQYVAKRAFSVR